MMHNTKIFLFFITLMTFSSLPGMSIKQSWAEEELIVSAAASLTNVMTAAKEVFQSSNPDVRLTFNFASSGSLYQQIKHGAPVDMYVSANQYFMDRAEDDGLILKNTRTDFTANKLVLIVPFNSGHSLTKLTALKKANIQRIAVGQPQTTPVGRYAKKALLHHDLWDTLEDKLIFGNSVRQILDYTVRGEVDAGFVYASDVLAVKGKVRVMMTVGNVGPIVYPIAVTASSPHPDTAIRFIRFLTDTTGQRILHQYGFIGLEKETP